MMDRDEFRFALILALCAVGLTPEQTAEEKRKLETAVSQRKSESPEKRAERVAKYEEERKRDHAMMDEMVKAFDFKLRGEINSRLMPSIFFRHLPGRDILRRIWRAGQLTEMQRKLWIDKKTFPWVKAEAEVMHPVDQGFLAELDRALISN
jgi:hypothetical protein